MDRSVMLAGLVFVYTSLFVFILMSVRCYFVQRIKVLRRLQKWVGLCVACWLIGVWIFAIGYLVL